MAKELDRSGTSGGFDPDSYTGMPVVVHERPEWSYPVPPESAAFGTRIQYWWSWIARWFRYPLVLALYVTEYWYRFVGVFFTVVLIVAIYMNR